MKLICAIFTLTAQRIVRGLRKFSARQMYISAQAGLQLFRQRALLSELGTTGGADVTVDLPTRIANLEAACGTAAGASPVWTGANQTPITTYTGTADVIAYPGRALINHNGGVDAATLAAPIAGAQSAGGDDGKSLIIFNGAAQANTVTAPASTIVNGGVSALHVITFAAHNGGSIELVAYNGLWYVVNTPINATLS